MRVRLRFFTVAFLGLFFSMQIGFGQIQLKELLSYPYPENLAASPKTGAMAWTFNQNGKRNIFISKDQGKTFEKLTDNTEDDGQKISQLNFSPDGKWLVYMRGGTPDDDWSQTKSLNPRSSAKGGEDYQMWSLNLSNNRTKVIAGSPDFHDYALSPDSRKVAFIKDGKVWIVPIDSSQEPHQLFVGNGHYNDLQWSTDGSKLAFVSNRGHHSFVGIYSDKETPIKWIHPAFSRDSHPRWSPGGDSLVFVRRPAIGGAKDSILKRQPHPWELRVTALQSEQESTLLWESDKTLNGSVPTTSGAYNLHWAKDRILFLSTEDNWPHLYSISPTGEDLKLLTPGRFMVDHISLSPDKTRVAFSANTGLDSLDVDRRHLGMVSVDKPDMSLLTSGEGIEYFPVFSAPHSLFYVSSDPYQPPLPTVLSLNTSRKRVIGKSLLSAVFSNEVLVKPKQVIYKSEDGTPIHAQLFDKPENKTRKRPAIVYIHGGPMRQMLLGWHYKRYYTAQYAVNQKLAALGFVVLSVNYRLGVGYGNDFHHPAQAYRQGGAEYQDVLAAGKWLAEQPGIDSTRIGVYGGSFGGYLTALALGKNSDLFAAGVDISGVHQLIDQSYTAGFKPAPDAKLADSVAWKASPVAHLKNWTSPVLLIHSDDDREVRFNQSIELLNRLKNNPHDVDYETLVIPDETHVWLMHENLLKIYEATIDFLERKLKE